MGYATSVGAIGLDLVVNKKNFDKQISGIQSLAKKTGLVLAAAFSVKKIVDFGKACLDLGSDLQEVQNIVDVTFTTMSDKVDEFAKNAISTAGLSETMAKRYAGTFGAMAKAFDFAESEALGMATSLTQLAGDVASFYNITQDEAYTKLKSVFTGETESLKDLGVVMTQSALDAYALANGYGKVTSAMTEGEKVALRYAFVTDQLSLAAGDFVRTSDGWANQVRMLNLQFNSLKATIGQGLIIALTPVIKWINALLNRLNLLASYFTAFTKALFGSMDAGAATANAISGIASVADAASSKIDGVTKAAEKLKKSARTAGFDELNVLPEKDDAADGSTDEATGAIPGVEVPNTDALETSIDTSGVEKAAEKLKSIFNGINDFFAEKKDKILATVAGLTAGVATFFLVSKWSGIVSTVTGAIAKVAAAFGGLVSGISLPAIAIAAVVALIVAAIVDLWNSSERFRDNMKQAWELISTAVVNAWQMLWNEGLKPLIDAVVQLGATLYEFYETSGIKSIFEFIVTGVTWIASILGSVLVTTISSVLNIILNAITKLIEGLTWIVDKMTWVCTNWDEIWAGIKETASNFIKNIVTGVTTGIENMKEGITNRLKLIKLTFLTIFAAIKSSTTSIFNGIWNGIKKTINSILGGIEAMANGVVRGVNRVISAMNNLSFDIPEWVPEFGGKTFGFNIPEMDEVRIPRLATGGYVKANTPRLAMIGDNKRYGEIVAPEDKMYQISFQAMIDAMKQFLQMTQMQQGNGDINLIISGELAPLFRFFKIELEKEGVRIGKNFEVVIQ